MATFRHVLMGCGTLHGDKPMMWHHSHCKFYRTKPYHEFDCTCMLHYWRKLMRLWAFLRGGMTGNDLGWR